MKDEKSRTKIIVAVITGFFLCASTFIGGLFTGKSREAQQVNQVNIDLNAWVSKYDDIERRFQEAQTENATLWAENVSLKENHSSLWAENSSLKETQTTQANVAIAITMPPATEALPEKITTTQATTTQASTTSSVPNNALFTMMAKNQSSWKVNHGEAKDGRGTLHNPRNYVVAGDWNSSRNSGSAEYIVNENYSRLTGTIAPHANMPDRSITLTIYAKSSQIYQSPPIRNTSLPIDFDVSLSGVENDVIKITTPSGPLLLMDFELHK